MIDIRWAQVSDIDNAIELMQEFQDESLGEYGLEIKVEQAKELLKKYVDTSLVAIRDNKIVGVIAGTITDYPLGGKIFQEIVWYVSKKHRVCGLLLFRELEEYCKKIGVSHIVMVHMANLKSQKLGKFYQRIGFKPLEIQYIKTVGG